MSVWHLIRTDEKCENVTEDHQVWVMHRVLRLLTLRANH